MLSAYNVTLVPSIDVLYLSYRNEFNQLSIVANIQGHFIGSGRSVITPLFSFSTLLLCILAIFLESYYKETEFAVLLDKWFVIVSESTKVTWDTELR